MTTRSLENGCVEEMASGSARCARGRRAARARIAIAAPFWLLGAVSCGPDEVWDAEPYIDPCGNGELDDDEECDDGNNNNRDECSNDCIIARCHDGIRQADEECDDDNTSNTDDCVDECVFATTCDGHVQVGVELCDDGPEGSEACPCVRATCGDGNLQPEGGEECDDGNAREDDGCTSACVLGNMCGNGILEEGEECDDGNHEDSDSCVSTCLWNSCQDGHRYLEATDDGNPNALEECDDGEMPEDATGEECLDDPRAYNGAPPCYCSPACEIAM